VKEFSWLIGANGSCGKCGDRRYKLSFGKQRLAKRMGESSVEDSSTNHKN